MKELLFLVALLIPCLALAEEPGTSPFGEEGAVEAALCVSKESALEIAGARVNQGAGSAMRRTMDYAEKHTCVSGMFTIPHTTPFRQIKGNYGVVDIYRIVFKGIPMYIVPVDGVTALDECSPSSEIGTDCA